MLDDLRHPGAKLRLIQRRQHRGINDDRLGLLERADQVLALGQIDPGLATHAGIDHREHRGGRLREAHPAHKGRRREARDVPGDPAAQREHHPAPIQAVGEELVVQPTDGGEGLVPLTVGDDAGEGGQSGRTKRILGQTGVEWRHHVVGDEGDTPASRDTRRPQRAPHVGQHAIADVDVIVPSGMTDWQCVGLNQCYHTLRYLLNRNPRGINLPGDGGVGIAAGRQQALNLGAGIVHVEQRALLRVTHPPQNLPGRGVQADDEAAIHHQGAVLGIDHGPAAGSDDQAFLRTQRLTKGRFHLPKGWFAILGEDARDRLTGPRFELGVHIDERQIQPPRHLAPDGGFARAHKTGDKKIT